MKKKLLSVMLLAAMIITMFPAAGTAAAAYADDSAAAAAGADGDNDGLVLNKTAVLEDDGTYTIRLTAYATGETRIVTETVPTDFIFVLDQSSSMKDNNIDSSTGYTVASPTNAALASGTYYVKVGSDYYKVSAAKTTVSTTTTKAYHDKNDNIYSVDELDSGKSYVAASYTTWTQKTRTESNITYYYFQSDSDPDICSPEAKESIADARTNLRTYLGTDYTIAFSGNTAKSFIKVTYGNVTVTTVRYDYSFTDASGSKVSLGSVEGIDTAVSEATAAPSKTLYSYSSSGTVTRLEALKTTATDFIAQIAENAKSTGADHRVAVVGFAGPCEEFGFTYQNAEDDDCTAYYSENSELFIGATQYNYAAGGTDSTYNTAGALASDHYGDAFQSAGTETGYNNLMASVNALAAGGGTQPEIGFTMANGIFAAYSDAKKNPEDEENTVSTYTKADSTLGTRNRVVIFLTDGEPGDWGFTTDTTTHDTQSGDKVAAMTIPIAQKTRETYGATVYTVAVLSETPSEKMQAFLASVSTDGKYTLAEDAGSLEEFFTEIARQQTSSSVALTANAVVRDVLSSYFVTDSKTTVQVSTAPYTGPDTFDETKATDCTASTTITPIKNGDSVIGYDVLYENFFTAQGNNWCVYNAGSNTYSGNELIVTITGVLAKDSAAQGLNNPVDTNTNESGIWDYVNGAQERTEVAAFNIPQTKIDTKLYVFDYAKKAELTTLTGDLKYDSAADGIFSKVDENSTFANAASDMKYGTFALDPTNAQLSYTPTTMQWGGYDSFYTFVKSDTASNRLWTKVAAIPANNVYYEDSFVMTSTDDTTKTGTVGIEYSTGWSAAVVDPGDPTAYTDNGTLETFEAEQGYIGGLLEETTWTDGNAHVSSTKQSTATFTFTGTGVDIYTSTNAKSGIVTATLTGGDLEKTKALIVNNEYDAGTLYQIPTLSWQGLTNGTYTVTLYVMPDSNASDANCTYYLDGVRIYKPLATEDATVQKAYGSGETNVSFYEVRDTLIDSDSLGDETTTGSVFIDSTSGSGETVYAIGKYETYGPKNEVYLAPDQAIVFTLKSGVGMVSVGLKSPDGQGTAVTFTYGTSTTSESITSTADLYYQIVPDASGRIMIKNTGKYLLAITKLKYKFSDGADHGSESPITNTGSNDALTYAASFDALGTVDYYGVPEEEDYVYDLSVSDETEQQAEAEQTAEETVVEELPAVEVQITNPEQVEMKDAALTFVINLFADIRNILCRR